MPNGDRGATLRRDPDPWRDFVADRLRESEARHNAQEAELLALRGSVGQMAAQLNQNTATTNEIKADTKDIREAMIGLKWVGKVAKWFTPVAVLAGVVIATYNKIWK